MGQKDIQEFVRGAVAPSLPQKENTGQGNIAWNASLSL